MVRRPRLIVQFALGAALVVLAFPADGSALRAVFIALTPTGPSPAVQTFPAGLYPVWRNHDAVTHTVVFANGLCSLQVAPGDYAQCTNAFIAYVGDYAYTVDGTAQASIVVVADSRAVSLEASSHAIARGSQLRLHGMLHDYDLSPPAAGPEQPIIVLARHDRYHPFRRIAVVTAKLHGRSKNFPFGRLIWQLRVRPDKRTIYIAEADSQPKGGQVWERAWSKPLKVVVMR
jgi:hypothetical protein